MHQRMSMGFERRSSKYWLQKLTAESNRNKNLGPEDQALVIPRGDLLCWSSLNY
jgi:hypothetical protein